MGKFGTKRWLLLGLLQVLLTAALPAEVLYPGAIHPFQISPRSQVSLVTGNVRWTDKRWGLIRGVEAGAGRMQVWRLVSARAGSSLLNASPDPVLESGAPVGMVGIVAERSLWWGFAAEARVRLVAAGHSPGGEVPFAHVTAHWDLTRRVFGSAGSRRIEFGLSGSHATSPRAVSSSPTATAAAPRSGWRMATSSWCRSAPPPCWWRAR